MTLDIERLLVFVWKYYSRSERGILLSVVSSHFI